MVHINEIEQKVEISYPCQWQYKLVGLDFERIHATVIKVVSNKTYTCQPSRTSSAGKFISLNLTVLVEDEPQRVYIYEQLKACDHILYIL